MSDHWKSVGPPDNILTYVNDFNCRLYTACTTARKKLGEAQEQMNDLFDQKVESRQFQPDDQVLVLLPIIGPPFQAKFHGPYKIKSVVS